MTSVGKVCVPRAKMLTKDGATAAAAAAGVAGADCCSYGVGGGRGEDGNKRTHVCMCLDEHGLLLLPLALPA